MKPLAIETVKPYLRKHSTTDVNTILVKQALTQKEIDTCFRVRYEVFAEELSCMPKNKRRLEYDKYDQHAIHFLATLGNKPIGTARIIMYDNKNKLPMDSLYNIAPFKQESLAEVSRTCVLAPYRKTKASYLMLKTSWLYGHNNGICHYVTNANPHDGNHDIMVNPKEGVFIKTLQKIGFTIFDEPKIYPKVKLWGVPMHLKIADTSPVFKRIFGQADSQILLD
jgi:predicted GNAT family N-acyltransferase